MLNPAAQPHRMGAIASGGDLLSPALIAGTGPGDHLLEHAGQQLPDLDGLRHATSPGTGASATTRSPGVSSVSS
jgi:hypothetical protein